MLIDHILHQRNEGFCHMTGKMCRECVTKKLKGIFVIYIDDLLKSSGVI